jgi:hypothetical protein
MFAATLEELGGQLAALQPPAAPDRSPQQPLSELVQRVLARAPSERLAAYAACAPPGRLQRGLPEALDANLRLLGVLGAEMRRFLRQLEALADAAAAAALAGGGTGGSEPGSPGVDGDAALLMAGVLAGVARETELVVSLRLEGGRRSGGMAALGNSTGRLSAASRSAFYVD